MAVLIGELGCIRYRLIEPLEVKVAENRRGAYMVYIDSIITEYGYGKTESEAVDDLRENIIHYYEALVWNEKRLGKSPKEDLRWLQKHIKVEWVDH